MTPEINGWNEWSHHVLKELERLDDDVKGLSDKIGLVREDIAALKVKVAVIGGGAGLIVGGIISLLSRILST
jgi:predicted  nucleic acid-binding Zn-ribbon protein